MDPRESPEFVAEWDVYRDASGQPVTITPEQCQAIWHAIGVAEAVRRQEGHQSLWAIRGATDAPGGDHVNYQSSPELAKSRLLGRMLFDGLPPTKTRPPSHLAGPAWWLLPDGDPFTREADDGVTPDFGPVSADTRALIARITGGGIRSRELHVELEDD